MLFNVINYSNEIVGQVEADNAVEAWEDAGKMFNNILDVRLVKGDNKYNYRKLPSYRASTKIRNIIELGSDEDKRILCLVQELFEEDEPSTKRVELIRTIEEKLSEKGIPISPLSKKDIQTIGYAEGLFEVRALMLFMPIEEIKKELELVPMPSEEEAKRIIRTEAWIIEALEKEKF